MDFLAKIIAAKEQRVAVAKAGNPFEEVRAEAQVVRDEAPQNRLVKALGSDSQISIIAEFKRRSPSKGEIKGQADAAAMAKIYEASGAAAISVLTEEDYFDGSLTDLRQIREAVTLPLLRKDFIFDEYQIYESAAAGADALLLIVAALDDERLVKLRAVTEDELGMDALVEVHTRAELDRAVKCGARLIGVNNRNLQTFEVSTAVSEQLAQVAAPDAILISESGLDQKEVHRLRAFGYSGFLVGEALMRAEDPAAELRGFIEGVDASTSRSVKVKICGITNLDDARAAIAAGADMLGFNFFGPSQRFIHPETAREIIETVRSKTDRARSVAMIGVFVNETIGEVMRIADDVKLDGVQLHGDETAGFCEQLKRLCGARMVIKAVSASTPLDSKALSKHPADSIMIDAFDSKLRGGTGRTADWTIAREAAAIIPAVILAGGLSPENVSAAIATVQPYAVDACSSLETSPGKKNGERMRQFVNAVRTSKLQQEPAIVREEN